LQRRRRWSVGRQQLPKRTVEGLDREELAQGDRLIRLIRVVGLIRETVKLKKTSRRTARRVLR
jgi:hypothetical protein